MNKQITVFAGCLIHNGKILMVQRDEPECPEAHLRWELPGGKVDFGETPEQSIIREFREETGVTVRVIGLLPFVQTVYWDYSWGKQQTLCFCFRCELVEEEELKTKDHHVRQVAWVELEKVKALNSLPGSSEIITLATSI